MRMIVLCTILSVGLAGRSAHAQVSGRPPDDLAGLERDWHDCVRAAFLLQPPTQSRAAAQRSALDACQAGEDAYVAAAMRMDGRAANRAARRGLTERARAWAASVAADVLDPVSSWLEALRR